MLNTSSNALSPINLNNLFTQLSKDPELLNCVDRLMFSNDQKEKMLLLKQLTNNNLTGDLKAMWASVLLEEAKTIKGE